MADSKKNESKTENEEKSYESPVKLIVFLSQTEVLNLGGLHQVSSSQARLEPYKWLGVQGIMVTHKDPTVPYNDFFPMTALKKVRLA